MVKLRLKMAGRKGRPFFRLGAFDEKAQRDGKAIEELGYVDPLAKTPEKQYVLKKDRIDYWLSKGAQPTESVAVILKKLASGKLYKPAPPPKPKKKAKAPEAAKPAEGAQAAPQEAPKAEPPAADAPKPTSAETPPAQEPPKPAETPKPTEGEKKS